MTPFQQHRLKWNNCTKCPLHEHRNKVVLARGKLPCQVLFIGEAPGESENVIGQPLVGPSGRVIDLIIERALRGKYTYAITNLVCCIPRTEEGNKAGEPPEESIEACEERLVEFVRIAQPRLIVTVGKLSKQYVGGQAMFSENTNHDAKNFGSLPWIPRPKFLEFADIVHPAFILRSDVSQQGLLVQRAVVTIQDALEVTFKE
jgi:DNA polymerase